MDVVRHLLPDVVVFATTLLTLIFNAKVVAGLVRESKREEKRRDMQTGREGQAREGSEEPVAAGSSEASGSGKYTFVSPYNTLVALIQIIVY